MYKLVFKRLIDFFLSLVALVILFPIFLCVFIFLTISNNGKPFFFQSRPGMGGEVFKIIKFKTMNDRKGKDGQLLPDRERLTKVGSFIRKTSLDEIPQLINVLIGNMSLIGPRPLLVEYLPLYSKEQSRRHNLRPGITGWAQVNGRNGIGWEEKFILDVWYVDNVCLALDFKIILLTFKKVLNREGISQEGQATMTKFEGKKNNI